MTEIKSVPEEEGREKFIDSLFSVLNREVEYGFILILTDKETWDFNHNNSITQVREALLSYARALEKHEGD